MSRILKYTQIRTWIDTKLLPVNRKKIMDADIKDVSKVVSTIMDGTFTEHWNHKALTSLRFRLSLLNEAYKKRQHNTAKMNMRRIRRLKKEKQKAEASQIKVDTPQIKVRRHTANFIVIDPLYWKPWDILRNICLLYTSPSPRDA